MQWKRAVLGGGGGVLPPSTGTCSRMIKGQLLIIIARRYYLETKENLPAANGKSAVLNVIAFPLCSWLLLSIGTCSLMLFRCSLTVDFFLLLVASLLLAAFDLDLCFGAL